MKGTHKTIKKLLAKAKVEQPVKFPPGSVIWFGPKPQNEVRAPLFDYIVSREEDYAGVPLTPKPVVPSDRVKPVVDVHMLELKNIFSTFKGRF